MRLLMTLIIFMTASCSRQLFSAPVLSRVDATLPMVRSNPEAYKGSHVMTGGVILDVHNGEKGGELEVQELPLDGRAMPKVTPTSSLGKFVVTSRDKLERNVYRKGMLVSLIGEVAGGKKVTSGGEELILPVLAIRELRLWTER